MVRKSWVLEVMSRVSTIIEEKIDSLEVELSSSITKVKDECVSNIEAEKPKSSSPPNVDIDIRKNEGDINLLQDDVINLKSDIRERDERIINLIKEIEEMKGKLNLLVEDELKEGIDSQLRKSLYKIKNFINLEKDTSSRMELLQIKYIEELSVSMVKVNCYTHKNNILL